MLLFHAAARDGDTVTVRTLQLYSRRTVLDQHPGLSCAAHNRHVPVTEKLVAAHYNIDLQQKKGSRRCASWPKMGMMSLSVCSLSLSMGMGYLSPTMTRSSSAFIVASPCFCVRHAEAD
jgi:hypothetical protein